LIAVFPLFFCSAVGRPPRGGWGPQGGGKKPPRVGSILLLGGGARGLLFLGGKGRFKRGGGGGGAPRWPFSPCSTGQGRALFWGRGGQRACGGGGGGGRGGGGGGSCGLLGGGGGGGGGSPPGRGQEGVPCFFPAKGVAGPEPPGGGGAQPRDIFRVLPGGVFPRRAILFFFFNRGGAGGTEERLVSAFFTAGRERGGGGGPRGVGAGLSGGAGDFVFRFLSGFFSPRVGNAPPPLRGAPFFFGRDRGQGGGGCLWAPVGWGTPGAPTVIAADFSEGGPGVFFLLGQSGGGPQRRCCCYGGIKNPGRKPGGGWETRL